MRQFYILITLVFMAVQTFASVPDKYLPYLAEVDSALLHEHEYVAELEEQIAVLRSQLRSTTNDEQRYVLSKLLSEKYVSFNSDSALFYLDQNLAVARQYRRQDWINKTLLLRSSLNTQTGNLLNGISDIDSIDFHTLPDHLKGEYYALRIFQNTQRTRLYGADTTPPQQLVDSLKIYANADNDYNHLWAMFFTYYENDRTQYLASLLENAYQLHLRENGPQSGRIAYMAALNYREMNNTDGWMEYVCHSAADNIRFVIRDYTALLDLISYLISEGDVARAYLYIDYIMEVQAEYPDYVRSLQIGQYMERIYDEMLKINERQQHITNQYLYALIVALGVLLVAFFFLVRLLRKQSRQQQVITDANTRLNQNIAQLTETQRQLEASNQQISEMNTELGAANYIKEQYIGSLFSTCSEYINKLDGFRLEINRKLKAGQVEDVLRQTRSDNSKTRDEVKELNRTFDSTFLSIYPDFVADFQTLLNDDEQMTVPKHGLNTELRIYALVWLGIGSSVKIAELLHISPQTVYNARLKVCGKSAVPCNSAKEFAARVQSLGRGKLFTGQS